jgi:hypothetical protein
MDTSLFIANKDIREIRIFVQRLTDPGNIAMTKDSKNTCKELGFIPIAMDILILQKSDDGLQS